MPDDQPQRDRLVPILYLIRGLPGAGKSTYANSLGCIVISPSDFMSRRGSQYQWIRGNYMISKMHFREIVRNLMALQIDIAIAEIMPEKPFIDFWLEEAKDYFYEVHIKTLLVPPEVSIKRNQHGADHKSVYEIHEQFDYSIIDQVIDYSNIYTRHTNEIQVDESQDVKTRKLLSEGGNL